MPDVFISYSKKDRYLAEELAAFLGEAGITTWWDENLVGGIPFRERINDVIEQSRGGVVIWSSNSIHSDFVVDEADLCRQQNKLISTLDEGMGADKVPLGFRNTHHLPLTDGNGLLEALKEKGVSNRGEVSGYVLRAFKHRIASRPTSPNRWRWPVTIVAMLVAGLAWPTISYLTQPPVDPFKSLYGFLGPVHK